MPSPITRTLAAVGTSVARGENAELVALRVGQHYPALLALADVDMPCAKTEDAIDLGLLVIGAEVEVDAVLDDLVVGHSDKQPVGSGAGRRVQYDVTVVVDVLRPAQHLRPPGTQRGGVVGVDADFVELQAHFSTPARSGPRFERELAVRPIELGLAAILTRVRLRVLMPRLPLAPVLARSSLRSSLAFVFGCSCLDSRSLRSSLVPRCDPHSRSSSGHSANSFFSTLPIALRGRFSTSRTSRGRLCTESSCATKSISTCGSASP